MSADAPAVAKKVVHANATAAIVELHRRCPGLRFCANRAKGKAFESGWHKVARPTDPKDWPVKWRGTDEFAVVPSTAGLFLVDVDGVLYVDEDGEVRERKPTKDEAQELGDVLGGGYYGYESTQGNGHYHLLFGDAANGGQDWNVGWWPLARTSAGFASQGGLLWPIGDGATIKFDTRGGGIKPTGEQNGCRIDADKRRLGHLLGALNKGVAPIANPEVLAAAYDIAHPTRRRFKKDDDSAPSVLNKIANASETLTGVHKMVLDETRSIANLNDEDLVAFARQELVERSYNARSQREGMGRLSLALLHDCEGEVDRALNGAIEKGLGAPQIPDSETEDCGANHFKFAEEFIEKADKNWRHDSGTNTWWMWDKTNRTWTERTHEARVIMMRIIKRQTEGSPSAMGKWRQQHHINGALGVASDTLHFDAATEFDANPDLAGIPNGRILDLNTGQIRNARRDDMTTKSLSVVPTEGETPKFDAFMQFSLGEFGEEAEDLYKALLWFIGGAMRGTVNKADSHGFVFLHGDSGTGKSTLATLIFRLMGSYATTVTSTRIVGRREDHLQWLLRLHGHRLVLAAELAQQPLKCEIVNAITAGDPIEANPMRGGSIDFQSVAHLICHANKKPSIDSPGTFRRMRLIEMNRKPKVENENLEDELLAEAPAILHKALSWRNETPRPAWPAKVMEDVRVYEQENDIIGQWLLEKCEDRPGEFTRTDEAYRDFSEWAKDSGYRPPTLTALSRALKKKGYDVNSGHKVNNVSKRCYEGLFLTDPPAPKTRF